MQASSGAIGGHWEASITQNEPFHIPKQGNPTHVVGSTSDDELELLLLELDGADEELEELELLLELEDDELDDELLDEDELLELDDELGLEELDSLDEDSLLELDDDELLESLELDDESLEDELLELLDDELLELLDDELLESLELDDELLDDELGIKQQHSIGGIICSTYFLRSRLPGDCLRLPSTSPIPKRRSNLRPLRRKCTQTDRQLLRLDQ